MQPFESLGSRVGCSGNVTKGRSQPSEAFYLVPAVEPRYGCVKLYDPDLCNRASPLMNLSGVAIHDNARHMTRYDSPTRKPGYQFATVRMYDTSV